MISLLRPHRRARLVFAILTLSLTALGCGARAFLMTDTRTLWSDLRVVLGGGGNTTYLLHGDEAFLIDPKMLGYGEHVEHQVEVELGRKVRRMLLTHSHFDHAGSAGEYPSVGAVIVHPNTEARLLAPNKGHPCRRPTWSDDPERGGLFAQSRSTLIPICALPFVEVTNEIELWLGGDEVQVMYLGVGHTDGDLIAYFPERKLLVAGDLVMNGYWPHIDPGAGGNLLELSRTLDRVLGLPFNQVVPGHGELGGREVVEQQRAYLRALEEDVRAAMARGESEDQAARTVPLRSEFAAMDHVPGDTHAAQVRLMYRALKEADRSFAP